MMEELREKIAKDVNESNLPLDCVYYLFKDLFRDLESQYSMYIQQNSKKEEQPTSENHVIKDEKSELEKGE